MKNHDFDNKSRKAHREYPPTPIPGDPFPSQPDVSDPPEPGDAGEIYPIDLGGGD